MNKKQKIIFGLGLISAAPITIVPLASKCSNNNEPVKLSTDESLEFIRNNKNNKNFVLLDVRTEGEIKENYIDGMINVNLNDPNFEQKINAFDKNKIYLVYCRTQNRSQAAAKIMQKLGFKNIYWMDGGITKWLRENKPHVDVKSSQKLLEIKSNKISFKPNEDISFNLETKNIEESSINYKFTLLDFKTKNQISTTTKILSKPFSSSIKELFGSSVVLETKKTYQLKVECIDISDVNEALFTFDIIGALSDDKNDYDSYKANGAYEHIAKNPSFEINEEFIKNFFNHNMYQYKTMSYTKQIKQINDIVDTTKKTIFIFGSPTCLTCLDYLADLNKLDLNKFNYVKVMTSVDNDRLDEYIELSKKAFKEKNILSELDDSLLDNQDFIWKNVMHFSTTPKILLLDEKGTVVNAIDGLEGNFNEEFIKVVKKTFDITITAKQSKPNIEDNLIKEAKDALSAYIKEIEAKKDALRADQKADLEKALEKAKTIENKANASKEELISAKNELKSSYETILAKPKPEEQNPNGPKFNNEYRTWEQRKRSEQNNPEFSDVRQDLIDNLYAKNVSELKIKKADDTEHKFSDIIAKNGKATIVIWGDIGCRYCLQALSYFKDKHFDDFNFVDLLDDYRDKAKWENTIDIYSNKSAIDKHIFRPTDDWNQVTSFSTFRPQVFILDKEQNITYTLGSAYRRSIELARLVGSTISTLDVNETDEQTNDTKTKDFYNGKYGEIKKIYPNDKNNITDQKHDLWESKPKKPYTRKSKIGDKEAEIQELKEIYHKFVTGLETEDLNLYEHNFNARYLAEAVFKWAQEDWIDNAYVHFGAYSINVETEEFKYNSKDKKIDDEFIKLAILKKFLYGLNNGVNSVDKRLVFDKNIKQKFVDFVKDALLLINEDMDEQEKIFVIMQYVADRYSYRDETWKPEFNLSGTIDLDFYGVCQQYSWMTSLLLNLVGIQSYPKKSEAGHHQFVWVKTKTKNDTEAKWYYVDTLHFDNEVDDNIVRYPSGYVNSSLKGSSKFKDGFLLKINLDADRRDLHYPGYRLFYRTLPIDHMFKDFAQNSYVDSTMLSHNNKGQRMTKNGWILSSIQSRFFKYQNNWYTFALYSGRANEKGMGLFKTNFHDGPNSFELVSNDDPIKKLIDDSFLNAKDSTIPKVFMVGNVAFVYKYSFDEKNNKHEHDLFAIDLREGKKVDLKTYFDTTTIAKNMELDIFSYDNSIYLIKRNANKIAIKKDPSLLTKINFNDIAELQQILNPRTTKYDIYKSVLAQRFEAGTYMYRDLSVITQQDGITFKSIDLRNSFDAKLKEFMTLYNTSSTTLAELINKEKEISDVLALIKKD
ncbi:rhodanese-like domain-containing protein [Mycoplasma enhydrae]|uniref:rhodanese-like domain-containing protein n=1 Tax=Mycoplasma enhydrae TaxID=2499220 RepID=UPI0021E845EF|nr:rhodanese-like domain-containing protein [Mycoplasma enhydrae]MCV3753672.1 rhodanese-like domain-containing protein [Mycoplasma enhydrae]